MRKRQIIPFLLAVVLLGGTLAVKLWPRAVPYEECSELYRRYADAEGINATFIKGFHVNDTVDVDVTLLEATDSAGWEKLVSDFNIPSIFLKGREDHFLAWRLKKGHTDGPLDPIPSNNDQIIIAEGLHKISIFHIDNEAQAFAIIHKNTEEIKH